MAVKKFTWKGKSEEEVATLGLKEFMALIPARARRSLMRGFTPAQKSFLKKLDSGEGNLRTQSRNMVIIPSMIGKLIKIHNGKDWVPLTITAEMLGHRFGEFAITRKSVKHSSAGVGATRSSKAVSAR